MALFHLQAKIHGKKFKDSNKEGSKKVAGIVAYRHCFEFDGFDYSKKSGFVTSFLLVPAEIAREIPEMEGLKRFPDEFKKEIQHKFFFEGSVKNFWRAIEQKEKRKDAQFCQELEISLQHELSLDENLANLQQLLQKNYISKGLCADVCIHDSGNNLHAHILIPQRPLEEIGLDLKADDIEFTYHFGNKLRDQEFYKNGAKVDQISVVREDWANLCNASFEKNGLEERISHLTLAEQKENALIAGDYEKVAELDREPAKHIFRNENIFVQNDREIAADKAERYNREEISRYEEQKRIYDNFNEYYINTYGDKEPEKPVLKPVLRTFQDILIFRKEQKLKTIKENLKNVTKYINDRIAILAPLLRRARTKTETFIERSRASLWHRKQNKRKASARISQGGYGSDFNRSISNEQEFALPNQSEQNKYGNIERNYRLNQDANTASDIELSKKIDEKLELRKNRLLWTPQWPPKLVPNT